MSLEKAMNLPGKRSSFRSGVEERSANEEEEQRVDSHHSRQEFETNTKPNTCENNNGGKVEKI